MSSAIAFNLDKSKKSFSCGTELTFPKGQILDAFKLKKSLQTTILNLMKMAENSQNALWKTHLEKEKLLITSKPCPGGAVVSVLHS